MQTAGQGAKDVGGDLMCGCCTDGFKCIGGCVKDCGIGDCFGDAFKCASGCLGGMDFGQICDTLGCLFGAIGSVNI